ncbi:MULTISPECIES: TetR/AcrR family transcriptional regulator [unclassified Frankia]|uniref:TetR/AcrR family transcriptional regulator n=1 Tax=unclassified Frankia TaxID=2632575 RepID=UPI001EF4A7DB|nr:MULTISPECIES: TetR/AcrR family transcriptional regulator [unclassified Frankia]
MPRQLMRHRLIEAAAQVIRTRGLAVATSKEIAREASVAVGSIYNHFTDKTDLITAVMLEGLPTLDSALDQLRFCIGRGTVQGNLEELSRSAITFFAQYLPLAGGLFTDTELHAAVRTRLVTDRRDLSAVHAGVAFYLAQEQQLDRINRDVEPEVAAAVLLGACSQYALLTHMSRPDVLPAAARYATLTVFMILPALRPPGTSTPDRTSQTRSGGLTAH